MPFDIPNLHIENDSPEGRVVQTIMQRDHVTAEEAVRKALAHAAPVIDEEQRFIAAVREGIADVEAGRVQDLDTAFAEIWAELERV